MECIRFVKTGMRTLLFMAVLTIILKSPVEAAAPRSSSGLTLTNSHKIYSTAEMNVYRGAAPKQKQLKELLDAGVERFLIFKNDTRGEVQKEIQELAAMGVAKSDILHLPMKWNEDLGFKSYCEMTLKAMKFLELSVNQGRSVYFHCTMGEDRTGYLAGLWDLWTGTSNSVTSTFQNQMCARGYADGLGKPYNISSQVHRTLTPQFAKMVELLKQARLQGKSLSRITCPQEQVLPAQASMLKCR